MSDAAPTGSPVDCSGLMYEGVPSMLGFFPASVIISDSPCTWSKAQRPRSVIFTS
jgi:hypothetical protein